MSVVPKSLFTWLVIVVFFIFLVIRVDGEVDWNWFIIFIPMWVLDAAVFILLSGNLILVYFVPGNASTVDRNDMTKGRKFGLLSCCILKIVFQVLVCLRLESFDISMYYLLIPFWICIAAGIYDNFKVLTSSHPYR